jgi:hypothetical protein
MKSKEQRPGSGKSYDTYATLGSNGSLCPSL